MCAAEKLCQRDGVTIGNGVIYYLNDYLIPAADARLFGPDDMCSISQKVHNR